MKLLFLAGTIIVESGDDIKGRIKLTGALLSLIIIHFAYYHFFYWVREAYEEDRLYMHTTRVKISSLYEGLRDDKDFVEWNCLIFFLRRSLFILITFTLIEHPGIQVMIFMQVIIFQIIWIGHMDYFLKVKYKIIEIVNEVILLLLSYHFLLSY